jgi:hypothetical protein
MSISSEASFMNMEPNIVKAQFILTNVRIYNLEFDQNIQMKELKDMIRVAAHLKKNNFRLFSDNQEYTEFNEETYDSLFPNQKFVVFHIIKGEGEVFDEAELLLQINAPCQNHSEKFLLFHCFDCNCSICCDCFTIGVHKGHHIQDKCFYLLPSKFLIDKMFQSFSRNPYDDYKITKDLSELKTRLNNVLFTNLFEMLKAVQAKCNDLIDNYNNVNNNSLGNLRDSVRDIRVSCIKALDQLKENLNVKDIVNNPKIFKEIDHSYKEMGKILNGKFQQNLEIFQQLNQQVSVLVSNLIEKIYNMILETLQSALNDQQYNNVKIQITQKLITPIDQYSIINQFGGKSHRSSQGGLNN